MSDTLFLTAAEVANRWKFTRDHVIKLAREGKIPSRRIGKTYRFVAEEIKAMENAQKIGLDDVVGKCAPCA